jgi:hypothetical protein
MLGAATTNGRLALVAVGYGMTEEFLTTVIASLRDAVIDAQ